MSTPTLEYRCLGPDCVSALAAFFADLVQAGDDRVFHPHPFTAEEATRLCHLTTADVYAVAQAGEQILAYGMLRGWEEGYQVPSLGIAVHPAARGQGIAKSFMLYLHAVARHRGAPKIRLKVYPTNHSAKALYERLGYQFESEAQGQLVGHLHLEARAHAA